MSGTAGLQWYARSIFLQGWRPAILQIRAASGEATLQGQSGALVLGTVMEMLHRYGVRSMGLGFPPFSLAMATHGFDKGRA